MHGVAIDALLSAVREKYGAASVTYYGSGPDERDGVGFRIEGIPATFSALEVVAAESGPLYDVQVEGVPPGNYLFMAVVGTAEFLELIDRFRAPEHDWPAPDAG